MTDSSKVWVSFAEDAQVGAPLYEDADNVYRKARIWRAGNYPEVGYSMTPEENLAAVEAFIAPVPLDLDHQESVIDDVGELVSIEAVDDTGAELHGIVRLPKALDSILSRTRRGVSCSWDRVTKRLTALALTPRPRIADAVLFSEPNGPTLEDEIDATVRLARAAVFDSQAGTPVQETGGLPRAGVQELARRTALGRAALDQAARQTGNWPPFSAEVAAVLAKGSSADRHWLDQDRRRQAQGS